MSRALFAAHTAMAVDGNRKSNHPKPHPRRKKARRGPIAMLRARRAGRPVPQPSLRPRPTAALTEKAR